MTILQVLAPADQSFVENPRTAQRRFSRNRTVITPISFYDEIKVEKRSGKTGIVFRCDVPSVPQATIILSCAAAKLS